MKTAIFVDGAFFLKRLNTLYKNKESSNLSDPKWISKELMTICLKHLVFKNGNHTQKTDLYRIFFYDCPPLTKKVHLPISHKALDFSKTPQAQLRLQIHEELKQKRKTALRLGKLQNFGYWALSPNILADLLKGKKSFSDLQDSDFHYEIRQKSVDMKIGLDIASVAYKKQVDRMVLIAGDSDFVPAAKLARREGIDFILDPMWMTVSSDLFEHIDGLYSTCYHTAEAVS